MVKTTTVTVRSMSLLVLANLEQPKSVTVGHRAPKIEVCVVQGSRPAARRGDGVLVPACSFLEARYATAKTTTAMGASTTAWRNPARRAATKEKKCAAVDSGSPATLHLQTLKFAMERTTTATG